VKRSAQFIDLIYDLEDVYDDGPDGRDAVDQYEHSVQTGTRALRAGLPDRLVALAVLHDAFRVIAPYNHGEALAVAIGDRLTPEEKAILANHSAWQHDILEGTNWTDEFKDSPWYEDGRKFGQFDAESFDPDYDSLPLVAFYSKIEALLDE
jgi:predicted HD phosphohydrolase